MKGCDCGGIPERLWSYDEALERLLGAVKTLEETEMIRLEEALGRVLAEPLISAIDVPPWESSAMDGYAIRLDEAEEARGRMPISQRIPAGTKGHPLGSKTAARIFTGASLPEGADTVVIQEDCCEEEGYVWIKKMPKRGANRRKAGEDTREGDEILPKGRKLRAYDLGLAASVGVAALRVVRRPRVVLLVTGDELVMPGEALGEGQIYNSNGFTAGGLLRHLGCEVLRVESLKDEFGATCEAMARAAKDADLVVVSGGVSVGEEDHVKPAIEKLGSLEFWKIAIRPGKPLAFGHIGKTPILGMPGNPVSLFVTFVLFARPFLLKMQGHSNPLVTPWLLEADFVWPQAGERREFARGQLAFDDEGRGRVRLYPSRSSGALRSVSWADGLVIIPEGRTIQRGEAIQFLHFRDLLS